MKSLLSAVLLVAVLCFLALSASAATRDPAPIVADEPEGDGKYLIGLFDVRPSKTVCENGVCRTVPAAASSPAVASADCACGDSCPCGSSAATVTTARRFRPLANSLERIRSWYPGKALRSLFVR